MLDESSEISRQQSPDTPTAKAVEKYLNSMRQLDPEVGKQKAIELARKEEELVSLIKTYPKRGNEEDPDSPYTDIEEPARGHRMSIYRPPTNEHVEFVVYPLDDLGDFGDIEKIGVGNVTFSSARTDNSSNRKIDALKQAAGLDTNTLLTIDLHADGKTMDQARQVASNDYSTAFLVTKEGGYCKISHLPDKIRDDRPHILGERKATRTGGLGGYYWSYPPKSVISEMTLSDFQLANRVVDSLITKLHPAQLPQPQPINK